MGTSKPRRQYAALPCRSGTEGQPEILLVTSRETGRWVLPKGWPMKLRRPHQAAAIEAYEEAGVRGRTVKTALGTYEYDKRIEGGAVRCRVRVYPMTVERLEDEWPEKAQRSRRWFSPLDAAERVDEPELRALLRDFALTIPTAEATDPMPVPAGKAANAKALKVAGAKKPAGKKALAKGAAKAGTRARKKPAAKKKAAKAGDATLDPRSIVKSVGKAARKVLEHLKAPTGKSGGKKAGRIRGATSTA